MTKTTFLKHDDHLVVDEKGSKKPKKRPAAVEKSFLIAGDSFGCDGPDLDWYRVDVFSLSSLNKRKRKRRLFKDPPLLNPIWKSNALFKSCLAVIGTTIYSVGGAKRRNPPTSDVYVADIIAIAAKEEDGVLRRQWTKITSMLTKRSGAKAVAVDDKLYVFGGIDLEPDDDDYHPPPPPPPPNISFSPWAEVFDPKKQLWTPLPEPPQQLSSLGLFAAYDSSDATTKKNNNKKIVVLGCLQSTLLLAYDVTGNTWETIDDKFEAFYGFIRPLLYDNSLYWIADDVGVYDLKLKQTSMGQIKVPYHFDHPGAYVYSRSSCFVPALLHVDADEFCFFWLFFADERDEEVYPGYLCCTNIRISKAVDDQMGRISSVKGLFLSTRRYPVVDQDMRSLDVLLLCIRLRVDDSSYLTFFEHTLEYTTSFSWHTTALFACI